MKGISFYIAAAGGLLTTGVAWAQEEGGSAGGGSMWQMMSMIGIALAFFYFIVLRPERKRRKAMEARRSSLQKGDKVTAMGIIGTVARINDETVILKLYDGAKMEVIKAAVTEVHPGTESDRRSVEETTVELTPEKG